MIKQIVSPLNLTLEALAIKAAKALDICMGDKLDRMACHREISRLQAGDRNAVIARVNYLAVDFDRVNAADRAWYQAKKVHVFTEMYKDGLLTADELEQAIK